MRKRTSKRRWKARCRLGREIPRVAIVEHELTRCFSFAPTSYNRDTYYVVAPRLPRLMSITHG